jgi:hypothetical protein
LSRNFKIIVAGVALLCLLIILHLVLHRRNRIADRHNADVSTRVVEANQEPRSEKIVRTRREQLDDAQRAALNDVLERRLKPALNGWCDAYAGHVPFRPDEVTAERFFERIGRGDTTMFVFVFNGTTLAIEDSGGSARVKYVNTPGSKQLMDMPKGVPPDPSVPVTRPELVQMLKADSGQDFMPAEIRVIPTAFSSSMNGGAHVNVGGDPNNIASWKFTMVFGPDGNLNYYCRGRP